MISMLTGPVHSGKSTFLDEVVFELREGIWTVGGFLSESIWDAAQCTGYDLVDLKKDKTYPYIRRTGQETWQRTGPFYFVPEGLKQARAIIRRDRKADLLVVDEVGPLELAGKGLWPALKDILFPPPTKLLLVTRDSLQDAWLQRLAPSKVEVFEFTRKDVFDRLMEAVTRV